MSIAREDLFKLASEKESFSIQELAELEKFTEKMIAEESDIDKYFIKDTLSRYMVELMTKCLGYEKDKIIPYGTSNLYRWDDIRECDIKVGTQEHEFEVNVGLGKFNVYFRKNCDKTYVPEYVGVTVEFNGKELWIRFKDSVKHVNMHHMHGDDILNLYMLHKNSLNWLEVYNERLKFLRNEVENVRSALQFYMDTNISSSMMDIDKLHKEAVEFYIYRMKKLDKLFEKSNKEKNLAKKSKIDYEIEAVKYAINTTLRIIFHSILMDLYWKDNVDAYKIFKSMEYHWFKTTYSIYLNKGDIFKNRPVSIWVERLIGDNDFELEI